MKNKESIEFIFFYDPAIDLDLKCIALPLNLNIISPSLLCSLL